MIHRPIRSQINPFARCPANTYRRTCCACDTGSRQPGGRRSTLQAFQFIQVPPSRRRADQLYLPILVRIVDNRLFVLAPLLVSGLPSGSEITAINGRPASEILSAMYENVMTDGANTTRKAYVASRVFNDLYPLFVDSAPLFRIEYGSAQGEPPGAVNLGGIHKAELERQAAEAGFPFGLPESGPAYSFVADLPGPALLAIRGLASNLGRF